MNKSNLFLMLGLAGGTILGLLASGSVAGFNSGSTGNSPRPQMDHSMHNMDAMTHDHDKVQEVGAGAVPAVQIALQSEGGCTYNMQLKLENFSLAPQNVNGPHKNGEGHAHLYADGKKLARIYSEWFHFSAPSGSQAIEVTLNSNDHAILAIEGKPITASAKLTDC